MPSARSPMPRTLSALIAAAAVAGCGAAARPAKAPPPPQPKVETPRVAEARSSAGAQAEAQRAWCGYLDALFRRASNDAHPWPHREACLAATSTASPAMLVRTAECSRRALDTFDGDPLTPAYAAMVRRCGVEALDAGALDAAGLDPFLDAVCRRAAACDGTPYDVCRGAMPPHALGKLGRAIGAINEPSRARLHVCLNAVGCEVPLEDRLSGCLDPIMEKLLWLPPGSEE